MARVLTGVKVSFSCVTSGERYDVVLNANQTPGTYWIHMRGLAECALPEEEIYQLAVLRYIGTNQARNDPPGYNGGFAGNGAVCESALSFSLSHNVWLYEETLLRYHICFTCSKQHSVGGFMSLAPN
jgi:hypothetical protein